MQVTEQDYRAMRSCVRRILASRPLHLQQWSEDIVQEAMIQLAATKKPRQEISFSRIAQWAVYQVGNSPQGFGGLTEATANARRRASVTVFAATHGLDPEAPATIEAWRRETAERRCDPARQGIFVEVAPQPTVTPAGDGDPWDHPDPSPTPEDLAVAEAEREEARARLFAASDPLSGEAKATLAALWIATEALPRRRAIDRPATAPAMAQVTGESPGTASRRIRALRAEVQRLGGEAA